MMWPCIKVSSRGSRVSLQYRDEVASEAAHQRVAWRRLVLYTPYTYVQAVVSTGLSRMLVHSIGQLTPAGDTRVVYILSEA